MGLCAHKKFQNYKNNYVLRKLYVIEFSSFTADSLKFGHPKLFGTLTGIDCNLICSKILQANQIFYQKYPIFSAAEVPHGSST